MQAPNLKKAGILALIIVVVSIGSWEFFIRAQNLPLDFDDGLELWSDKRAMVYEPIDKATVFIGASRNKYDIDINTWEAITTDHAIQLAIEGNSPLPVLDDLAADKNFNGKVIVDVTERLFFTSRPNSINEPKDHVLHYKNRTPAQRFSFLVNHFLESKFIFLDKWIFSLNGLLNKLPVSNRKSFISEPFDYPYQASRINFNRQNYMMKSFLVDTTMQNHVKAIWVYCDKRNTELPATGQRLDSFLISIKNATDKIKGRGGKVLFVRTPSSGYYWQTESKNFPREKYWDKLLTYTNCNGIHFKDYPAIANFECPEWSHLSRQQAIVFTKNLIQILQEEKDWSFPHIKNVLAAN